MTERGPVAGGFFEAGAEMRPRAEGEPPGRWARAAPLFGFRLAVTGGFPYRRVFFALVFTLTVFDQSEKYFTPSTVLYERTCR